MLLSVNCAIECICNCKQCELVKTPYFWSQSLYMAYINSAPAYHFCRPTHCSRNR